MSLLALSDSFEYLCYQSMIIRNIFALTVRGSTLTLSPLKPAFMCIQHIKTGFSGERVKRQNLGSTDVPAL